MTVVQSQIWYFPQATGESGTTDGTETPVGLMPADMSASGAIPNGLKKLTLTFPNIPTDGTEDGQIWQWSDYLQQWVLADPPSGTVPSGTDPGDLLVWDGDSWEDLPIGTDDHVLTADSGEALGVKWAAPGAASLGAWTDYTPTLTATTTNPTLGSSTLSGRYKQLDATTYVVRLAMSVTTGGAWNAGSGEWKFSLPSGLTAAGTVHAVGSVHVLDAGIARFSGAALVVSGQSVIHPITVSDATGTRILAHNVPVTWATGDEINIQVLVEVA